MEEPITREEQYLAAIAGGSNPVPDTPITRTEQYLAAILDGGVGGASSMAELTDADIDNPSDGQTLQYDGTSGKWKNTDAPIDPDVVAEAVSDWLDDHPEATTTVEDGSITKAKLDSDLQDTVDDVSDLKSALANIPISAKNYQNLITADTAHTDLTASKKLDANGDVVDDTTYTNSVVVGPVAVEAGKKYTLSFLRNQICVYNASNTYLSALWSSTGFTIPANGAYIKFTVTKPIADFEFNGTVAANAAHLYLVEGTSIPDDVGYVRVDDLLIKGDNFKTATLPSSVLAEKTIGVNKLGFVSSNINLLSTVGSTANVNLVNSIPMDANFSSNGFTASDPIPVISGASYKLSTASSVNVKQYDANGNYVKNSDGTTPFTIADNAKFIRVSAQTSAYNVTVKLFEADADTALEGTFSMPNLKVNASNLGADVLAAVKQTPAGILSGLTFATNTVHIKLLGDSITHGMGSTDYNGGVTETEPENYDFSILKDATRYYVKRSTGVKSWAAQFAAYLEDKFNCSVVNNAVSGISAVRIIDNWETLVDDTDDIVIVMIGTNDRLFFNDNDLWNTYRGKLESIYELAHDDGKQIFFIAPPPASIAQETEVDGVPKTFTMHMEDVSNIIKYVSNSIGVDGVHLYDEFIAYCDTAGVTIDSLLNDGLHPNDNGYALMYRLILTGCGFSVKRNGATW